MENRNARDALDKITAAVHSAIVFPEDHVRFINLTELCYEGKGGVPKPSRSILHTFDPNNVPVANISVQDELLAHVRNLDSTQNALMLPLERLVTSFSYFRLRDYWGPIELKHITTSRVWKALRRYVSQAREGLVSVNIYMACTGYWIDLERKRALANSLFVFGVMLILLFHKTAEEVCRMLPLSVLPPFQDASGHECQFELTLYDCLTGLERAKSLNMLPTEWYMDDVPESVVVEGENILDWDWVVKGRLIAFRGPDVASEPSTTPASFYNLFKRLGVTAIVRLNADPITYDREQFLSNGFRHYDMCFSDGGIPPAPILREFLQTMEMETGVVAVHCKMGVGRTGTLATAFIMAKYLFEVKSAIGYIRAARSGCVVGTQQLFLHKAQFQLWKYGNYLRQARRRGGSPRRIKSKRLPEPLLAVDIPPEEEAMWTRPNRRLRIMNALRSWQLPEELFVLLMNKVDSNELDSADAANAYLCKMLSSSTQQAGLPPMAIPNLVTEGMIVDG